MCVWLVATIGSHSLKRVAEPLKCESVVIMCVCIHFDVHVHFTLFLLLFLVPLSDCEELHFSAGEFCYNFNNVSNDGCGL